MTDARQLLELLADGVFHSGQDLALKLGVSRSAVWKRLQQLQKMLNIELHAVSGKGYRLTKPLQMLDPDGLRQHLCQATAANHFPKIEVCLTLDSTNLHALALARKAPTISRVVLAERQTAGRGRRGRQWISPFGRNLYLSLYWWFDVMPESIATLSLVAGMVLAKRLEAMGIPRCELKWPNDVRYQGKKLAGILLEMHGEATGGCGIVIGMGVNLDMPVNEAGLIDQPWTDVNRILGKDIDRNQFAVLLISDLIEVLNHYNQERTLAYLEDWQCRDVLQGQLVTLELPNESIQGVARGIDSQGALLLEVDGRTRRFFSGEVSVRLAEKNG